MSFKGERPPVPRVSITSNGQKPPLSPLTLKEKATTPRLPAAKDKDPNYKQVDAITGAEVQSASSTKVKSNKTQELRMKRMREEQAKKDQIEKSQLVKSDRGSSKKSKDRPKSQLSYSKSKPQKKHEKEESKIPEKLKIIDQESSVKSFYSDTVIERQAECDLDSENALTLNKNMSFPKTPVKQKSTVNRVSFSSKTNSDAKYDRVNKVDDFSSEDIEQFEEKIIEVPEGTEEIEESEIQEGVPELGNLGMTRSQSHKEPKNLEIQEGTEYKKTKTQNVVDQSQDQPIFLDQEDSEGEQKDLHN